MNTIWQPDLDRFNTLAQAHPKYRALAQLIEQAIAEEALVFGQKLPPQRQLADFLSITHGTVTRAYALLEQRAVVTARLGAGTFVAVKEQVSEYASETDFASSMQPMMGQQQVLAKAMQSLANEPVELEQLMTYKLNGLPHHQRFFKSWLQQKGLECEQHEVVFCQGAQQGIYASLASVCQPNDFVVHESLCYPGFYHACDALNLNTLGIAVQEDGLDLEALEQACKTHSVKAIYITPNCQNPTNVRYSDEKLQQLLALSRRYNFFILEDDVNYCLPGNWRIPLWQQAPDRVFYIASFSKYFAGGLRAGYVLAPVLWQQTLLKQIHSQCWAVSMMNFELLMRSLKSKEFAYNQDKLAEEIRYRIAALQEVFAKHQMTAVFAGLNVFIPLASELNMHALAGQLKANKVEVRTLDVFENPKQPSDNTLNGLRFTLGGPSSRAEFDLGVKRVDDVFEQLKRPTNIVI